MRARMDGWTAPRRARARPEANTAQREHDAAHLITPRMGRIAPAPRPP